MKTKDDKIKKLWEWFFRHEQQIKHCVETDSASERSFIIENLDNLVLDLGMFTWEIDTGIRKPWSFTISPNGDLELMKKSKKIIEEAPDLADWEFNYSKPAKDWDRKFFVFDEYMIKRAIDASDWKFVAFQQNDGMTTILLEANNINDLDNYTAATAANIVVLNEIGEETKIHYISSVEIVNQLEDKYTSSKQGIQYLKKRIGELSTLRRK